MLKVWLREIEGNCERLLEVVISVAVKGKIESMYKEIQRGSQ